jgi:hypothetical protein
VKEILSHQVKLPASLPGMGTNEIPKKAPAQVTDIAGQFYMISHRFPFVLIIEV